MNSECIGERGILFTFDDPYYFNTYVIAGSQYIFIFDTFCGPDAMNDVLSSLHRKGLLTEQKRYIVLNSHYHYDHIWGNSVFVRDIIMAHISCSKLIQEHGPESLQKYRNHAKGEVELVLPSIGFNTEVLFPEERVLLFHSPGHTEDGISLYDMKEGVLLVGDNVESPIPFLYQPNIKLYKNTLKKYLSMDWHTCIASHDPIMKDDSLIKRNLDYLDSFSEWNIDLSELDERMRALHLTNLSSLASDSNPSQLNENAIAHYKEALRFIDALRHMDEREEIEERLRTVAG